MSKIDILTPGPDGGKPKDPLIKIETPIGASGRKLSKEEIKKSEDLLKQIKTDKEIEEKRKEGKLLSKEEAARLRLIEKEKDSKTKEAPETKTEAKTEAETEKETKVEVETVEEKTKAEKLAEKLAEKREAFVREELNAMAQMNILQRIWAKVASPTASMRKKIEDFGNYKKLRKEYLDVLDEMRAQMIEEEKKKRKREIIGKKGEKWLKEETKRITKATVVKEALNLYDTKMRLQTESKGKKLLEKGLKCGLRAVEWYRRLPIKYKIAFAGILLGGGFVAGALEGAAGVALATGLVVGRLAQRVFGGAALAVGAEAAMHRAQEKKAEEQVLKEFGNRLAESLKHNNEELDNRLLELAQKKQSEKIRRYVLAGVLGGLITSGLVAKAIRAGIDYFWPPNIGPSFYLLPHEHTSAVHAPEPGAPEAPDSATGGPSSGLTDGLVDKSAVHAPEPGAPEAPDSATGGPSSGLTDGLVDKSAVHAPEPGAPEAPDSATGGPSSGLTDGLVDKSAVHAPEPGAPEAPDSATGGPSSGLTGGAAEHLATNEHLTSNIETVTKGSSLWKLIEHRLQSDRFIGEQFTGLDEARKTYIIDAIKDRIAANPKAFGLDNIDQLKIGQKIDFSKIFEDKSFLDKIMEKAGGLKSPELKSILNHNRILSEWLKAHPNEALTSSRVEEILHSHTSVSEAGTQAASGAVEPLHVEAPTGGGSHIEAPPSGAPAAETSTSPSHDAGYHEPSLADHERGYNAFGKTGHAEGSLGKNPYSDYAPGANASNLTPEVTPSSAEVNVGNEAAESLPVNKEAVLKSIFQFHPSEYNAIKGLSIKEFLEKIPSADAARQAWENNQLGLPHGGNVYDLTELEKQIKLADYLRKLKPNANLGRITIEEFFKNNRYNANM